MIEHLVPAFSMGVSRPYPRSLLVEAGGVGLRDRTFFTELRAERAR